MKKLLLLVITCAVSAGFISAAEETSAPDAPPAAPAVEKGFLGNKWVQAGLWVGGGILAYDVLNQVTDLGHGTIDTTATLLQIKGLLYKFQQSLPASVRANPKASALAFAVAVTAATHHGLSFPKESLGMAIQATAVYSAALWALTHEIADPNADATTVASN